MTGIEDFDEAVTQHAFEASETVEAAVIGLNRLEHLPTTDHVQVFEEIQHVLAETLSSVDDA